MVKVHAVHPKWFVFMTCMCALVLGGNCRRTGENCANPRVAIDSLPFLSTRLISEFLRKNGTVNYVR